MGRWLPAALAAAFLCVPPPAPAEAPTLVAAAWCPVISGDAEPETVCDLGIGVALANRGRLAWVAAIGAETVGTGAAWVAHSGDAVTIAVAIGVIAPYDENGIRAGVDPALGATFGFGGEEP